uniref:Large ribosomal subunit protein uL5c n=1 Tax=Cyanidium sp. THAL103 TaxID=3027999 RepID=A0A9Y1MYC8_9RHOD|nr:ribosomal protein L5 [Cyanidium sp. THAL103]
MHKNLKEIYIHQSLPILRSKFNYKNIHQIPKLIKINVNRGLSDASQNLKLIESSIKEFSIITGQKPLIIKSKKSIAGFKLRENVPIGIKVTLRKSNMYVFLDKLINLSLPRIKDFRGLSVNSFDGNGNYNLGIREQLVFPEISYDKIETIMGFDISIVTTANTDEEGKALLRSLGMPFKDYNL